MIINMVGGGGGGGSPTQAGAYKRYYAEKRSTQSNSEKAINCSITFPDIGVYYVFAPYYVAAGTSHNGPESRPASWYSVDSGDIDIEFLASGANGPFPFFLMRVKQANSAVSFKTYPWLGTTPRYLYMDVNILRVDGGGANNAVATLTYVAS